MLPNAGALVARRIVAACLGDEAPFQPGQLRGVHRALNARTRLAELPDGVQGVTMLGDPPLIEINERLSGNVRRFTLAHELGHVMVASEPALEVLGGPTPTGVDLERLCDRLAAEILMPHRWMEQVLGRGAPACERDVLHLAQFCEVSVPAFTNRLAHLGVHVTRGSFQHSRRAGWMLMSTAGRRLDWLGRPRECAGWAQVTSSVPARVEARHAFDVNSRVLVELTRHGAQVNAWVFDRSWHRG